MTSTDVHYLMALVDTYERDGRATVRAVARAADRGVASTHRALERLCDVGLAAQGPGKGTLRPLVFRPEIALNIPR